MSKTRILVILAACATVTARSAPCATNEELEQQVRTAEATFARSMADRDHAAFAAYLADEAVFFGGAGKVLRGKEAVAAGWKPFFEGAEAPFSWEPELVVVLDSGTLAHSSGPVRDPQGQQVATFNSIWRLEPDGRWRVVFDRGCAACPSPTAP